MKAKVLIVDDIEVNIDLIINILEFSSEEYIIYSAKDGIEGCRKAREIIPDIILMDWEMPRMSGFDAIKELKSDRLTSDIPILMITAYATPEHLRDSFNAGAIDYIKKPLNPIELRARVKSALHLHQSIRIIKEQNIALEKYTRDLKKLAFLSRETENSFLTVKLDGSIEWVNDGFTKIHGFTLKEFKEKYGDNLYTSEHHKDFKDHFLRCISSGEGVSFSTQIEHKNDAIKWVHVSITPTFYKDDTIDFVAITETDITEIKEKEKELNKKNHILEVFAQNLEEANKKLEDQKEEMNKQKKAIEEEKTKTDNLLLNIFPFEVAKQLKSKGFASPRNYKEVTVLFTDFKNFSKNSAQLPPKELVNILDGYFKTFDEIISEHYLEKIKTIGDAYMCAGGLPLRNKSNPFDAVLAALRIQNFMNEANDRYYVNNETPWELRLGIHTGPVIAGVVGTTKFAYDIWGPTVNIASRMESSGHVGMINVSETTYNYVKEYFITKHRGKVETKNIGKIDMYFIERIKPEFSEDEKGIFPNESFQSFLSKL
jgi:PAS domain S-box-containing protein